VAPAFAVQGSVTRESPGVAARFVGGWRPTKTVKVTLESLWLFCVIWRLLAGSVKLWPSPSDVTKSVLVTPPGQR
jgi:hypothetical protein